MANIDSDLALALSLQNEELLLCDSSIQHDAENCSEVTSRDNCALPSKSHDLCDPSHELVDPTPDIHQLFVEFDTAFFWRRLRCVVVSWSRRMTRCAGVCSYQPRSGLCSIRLSQPLLTLRPRCDLVQTLLHEMIHAFLFVTGNSDNRQEHGPEFHRHMRRINTAANTSITVYHSFHAEVEQQLTHWWRCDGPCRRRPPYFGFVKRAMNRPPAPRDFWWSQHRNSCGGTFEKIRQPDNYGCKRPKNDALSQKKSAKRQPDIAAFFRQKSPPPTDDITENTTERSQEVKLPSGDLRGHRLGGQTKIPWYKLPKMSSSPDSGQRNGHGVSDSDVPMNDRVDGGSVTVNCPVCGDSVLFAAINAHMDKCLMTHGDKCDALDDNDAAVRALRQFEISLKTSADCDGDDDGDECLFVNVSTKNSQVSEVIVIDDDDEMMIRDACSSSRSLSSFVQKFLADDDDDVELSSIQV